MDNVWIVVPVISNDTDLTGFVNKISGGYVAPETYEKKVFNQETRELETKNVAHPYAGQTGPNLSGRIIFVNKVSGYTEYDGVAHLEDFNDINIYRYWNTGFEYAVANGADSVILLNGVIDFDPFIIKDASDNFVATGKEVINLADGAMLLVSAASDLRADEQFQIWFGDNDFYRRAEDVLGQYRSDFSEMNYIFDHNNDEAFNAIVTSDETKYNAKWN
jgi:hypothetical protein